MKKRTIPTGFEIAGAVIFLIGLLYYIFFGTLPYPCPKFTPELAEKYLFHQGMSTKIMTTGGIFLFIGLITMLVIIFTTLITKKELGGLALVKLPEKSNSHAVILIRYSMLVVPFFIPVLFNFFYEPINENITVKYFGCGCPRLDGSYGFNSNCFNAILWMPVVFISILLWTSFAKQVFKKTTKFWAIQGAIYILVYLAFRFYARSFWL